MTFLTFFRCGSPVFRHELHQRKDSTIGRSPSCDVQLVEGTISRIHAIIARENGQFVLKDSSTNGTFVGPKKISTHELKSGDSFAIGEWTVKFTEDDDCETAKTAICGKNGDEIIRYDPSSRKLLLRTIELKITQTGGLVQRHVVGQARIGSDEANDIVVNDDYVSKRHCMIIPEAGGFVVKDRRSTNGTFLDDQRVGKARLPRSGRIIIGGTTIDFRQKKLHERLNPSTDERLGPIIGKSRVMKQIFSIINRVAATDATVCICGESGTGKELIAQHIHESSPRAGGPFIAINCGAVPANLIESELFGHERGAFTSATNLHKGVFEQADGGTLFLDEIGEMPADLQVRLLRILETMMVKRVGGTADIPVSVRVITATNKDLKKLVAERRFREDLFYRLYVVPIIVPPLRQRKEDIPLLAEYFLDEMLPPDTVKFLTSGAIARFTRYAWPGNVRELRHCIQRTVLLTAHKGIKCDDIFLSSSDGGNRKKSSLREQKKAALIEALSVSGGNASLAARQMGIARSTIIEMAKKFSLKFGDFRLFK